MNEKLFLPILLGTSREARRSIQVAHFVESVIRTRTEIETELIDPQKLHLPFDGNDKDIRDPHYAEVTNRADGFIIVTPEYNHGYPGSLKRMLDSEFGNYKHKPVAFVGCSDGQWGGVRVIEALLPVVRTLKLVPSSSDVQFPNIDEMFDSSGQLEDAAAYEKRVNRMLDELVWLARTLKWGRENLS